MGFFNFFKRDISEEEFQEQQKVKRGLEKTRTGFFQSIVNTLTNAQIDDDLYDQLEEQLILADVGQDELFLELVVQIIVDLRVGQRIDDALEKARAGLFQPALDLLLLLKFLLGNIAFEKVEKAHRGPPYF